MEKVAQTADLHLCQCLDLLSNDDVVLILIFCRQQVMWIQQQMLSYRYPPIADSSLQIPARLSCQFPMSRLGKRQSLGEELA